MMATYAYKSRRVPREVFGLSCIALVSLSIASLILLLVYADGRIEEHTVIPILISFLALAACSLFAMIISGWMYMARSFKRKTRPT